MAINIKFDLVGNPEPPTIILANRNGNKLGQLDVDANSIDLSDKFNDASEFSFTLFKYAKGKRTNLWDKVVDFKLVYCKEWDMWFEIKVELDEETETVKTVFCTQLGQAELSQIMLYNIEINTEEDIERDDYKISILYDSTDPKASILNRMLEKAPHYSIIHVDPTIANIQRSFSFDGTSIYDAFQEIAEEIGCLFVFNSNSGEDGKIQRTISVYDLQQNCLDINCGYRGEFTDVCPKCGSTNIKYGYGDDTLIFVTSDELAAGGIQLVTDVDSVKNCFKLEAGDDLMTATVRNCNPNGTDYIWYFSEDAKEDMPNELVEKIESYDDKYRDYYNNYESDIDTDLLNDYNELVRKYSIYKKDLQQIATPIKGYSNLMNAYYNVVDLALFLESGLMPSVEISETNAEEQAKLLTSSALSPVAVANISSVSLATANSAVLAMAKIIVKSTYKTEVKASVLIDNGDGTKTWAGNFIVTNYSDKEDTAESSVISIIVNGDEESFIKQKIEKALNKENTDDLSISGLFEKGYDDFCLELKKYALNPLTSFHDACQVCIDIMIEQGVGNGDTWSDNNEGADGNLYEKLYEPYYNKLMAIEAEMKIREDEVAFIKGVYDSNDVLVTDGLIAYIEKAKTKIQNELNFENYLGSDLWLTFCSYRREDKYENSNYISDGLNNAELFKKANEFIEVAENEIYKSSELQHSISTTLKNLLAIPKFEKLVKSFGVGNWIRVQVDDKIYKLRLIEYEIDYGDFENIPVEFSDLTKVKNGATDIQDILSQASSMATSYDSVQKQAKQGNDAQGTIDRWLLNGLNSALVQIQNNDSEEITFNKNGLLGRSYNDITGTYSPEQIKLTHNIIAYTDDDWKTVKQAIGKHNYVTYSQSSDDWVLDSGYGMSAEFVTAGQVMGSKIVGGEVYSSNYHKGVVGSSTNKPQGTYINLTTGDFELGSGKIVYSSSNNTVTLDGVIIKWDTTNTPTIGDVDGLTDLIDDKSTIYTSKPSFQRQGDLLIPTSTFTETYNSIRYTFTAQKVYRCTTESSRFIPSYWTEVGYTDDTKANSAYSLADSAKTIGDSLVNGLGFKETEITGSYVISPVIAGGQLLIGDTTGTYAQITTEGKLICKNAEIDGTIKGGYIESINYEKNVQGTHISLNDGYFEVGGGQLTYSDNTLSLGKKNTSSYINLCGGVGKVGYSYTGEDSNRNGLVISSDSSDVEIRTNENGKVYLHAEWNDIGTSSYISCDPASNISLVSRYMRGDDRNVSNISVIYSGIGLNSNNGTVRLSASEGAVIAHDTSLCLEYWEYDKYYNVDVMRMGGTEGSPILLIGDGFYSDSGVYGNTHICSSDFTMLLTKNNRVRLINYDNSDYNASFEPVNMHDKGVTLGTSGKKWHAVYLQNATIQTSDEREKENITALGTNPVATLSIDDETNEQVDIHSELFDRLQPVQYNFINGDGRICYGLIAQQVAEVLEELGYDENELDLVHHDYWTSESGTKKDSYGLAYANIIALLIHEVQKLKKKIK